MIHIKGRLGPVHNYFFIKCGFSSLTLHQGYAYNFFLLVHNCITFNSFSSIASLSTIYLFTVAFCLSSKTTQRAAILPHFALAAIFWRHDNQINLKLFQLNCILHYNKNLSQNWVYLEWWDLVCESVSVSVNEAWINLL